MKNVEKQKNGEKEMQTLVRNKWKLVILNKVLHDRNIEVRGVLEEVSPYKLIVVFDGIEHHQEPFIGKNCGIGKITEMETNKILYENTTLNFDPKILSNDELLAHTNNLRVLKYGTNEYNLKSFMD